MHLAQISGINSPSSVFTNPSTLPTDLATRFLRYAILGAGLILFIRLVSAGFSYMTAAGDPGKIQSATKSLTQSLIGIIVVLSAYFIIQIIQVIFGLKIL